MSNSISRRLSPSPVFRQTFIYFFTVGVGQLTSLLLLPIITRFLQPAEYGRYVLVLAVTGLIGVVGSTWVRNVAIRLYFEYAANERTRAFFWTAAGTQLISTAACLAIGYAVARLAGRQLVPGLYASAGLCMFVSDFYGLAAGTLRAGHKATFFGAAEFSSSVLRLGTTWVGLLAGFRSATMLFVFATVGMTLAAIIAGVGLRRLLTGSAEFDRSIASELIRVGIPSIPLSIGGWLMALSDRTILAYFVGLQAVGIYSAAYGLADRAIGGLSAALFLVTWPTMLSGWSRDPLAAPQLIARSLEAYILLSVGPAVVLVAYRSFLLGLLTSPDYLAAVGVIPWVVAGAWILGVTGYLNRPLELTKQYGVVSVLAIGSAVVNLVLNLLLVPRWGIVAAAFSTTSAYVVGAVVSRVAANRVLAVPLPWSSLAVAGGAAAISIVIASLFRSPYFAIVIYASLYSTLVGTWAWFGGTRPGTASTATAVAPDGAS